MTTGVQPFSEIAAAQISNLVAGPDGNLWVGSTPGATTPIVFRISPTGVFTTFPIPTDESVVKVVISSLANGPDGYIWFSANFFTDTTEEVVIGNVTPAGQVTEFPAVADPSGQPDSGGEIVNGPDGDLWFSLQTLSQPDQINPAHIAQTAQNFIGQISTAGAVTLHPITTSNASLTTTGAGASLVAGGDGNLWFTQGNGKVIGRMTPDGEVTTFPVGNFVSANLVNGTNGTFLVDGLTHKGGNQLVVVTTAGVTKPYKLPRTGKNDAVLPLGTAAGALAFQGDTGSPSLLVSPKSGTARTVSLVSPNKKSRVGWSESIATAQDGTTYLAAFNGGYTGANTVVYQITPAQLAGKTRAKR